jgi:hypothetical protein
VLSHNVQANTFLYIQSDVPPGLELRDWRRQAASPGKGLRRRLRRARHHARRP